MAATFDQPLNWDTSAVTDMAGLFAGARNFNQKASVQGWNTAEVSSDAWARVLGEVATPHCRASATPSMPAIASKAPDFAHYDRSRPSQIS